MAASNPKTVLSLYKVMLRESGKFVDINYRSYAIRRIKDSFKTNSKLTESAKIEQQIQYAKENLKIIQRQTTVGQLFGLGQQLSVGAPK